MSKKLAFAVTHTPDFIRNVIENPKKRMNNTNHNEQQSSTTTAEIIELMTSMLLTDGSLSEEQMENIRSYLTDGKDMEAKMKALQANILVCLQTSRLFGSFPFTAEEEDVERGWARLADRLGLDPDIWHYRAIWKSRDSDVQRSTMSEPQPAAPARRKPGRRLSFGQAAIRAVAVLVPSMIVGGYFLYERSGMVPRGATASEPAVSAQPFAAANTVSAEQDSVRQIMLPDGTEVTLNAGATFAYNDNREAVLSGEAFFKVAKDPEHPFVIHSDNLTVTVHGTEFNFHTQTEEGQTVLSLYEGVVELGSAARTNRIYTAGTEFVLDNTTFESDIRTFNISARPQWLTAYETRLEFHGIGEIFDMIEAHYGVRIVNRNVIDTSRRYNFTLDSASSAEAAMHTLELAGGEFGYTTDGTAITLTEKQR